MKHMVCMNTLKEVLEWLRTADLTCLGCGAKLSGRRPQKYRNRFGIEGWWVYITCKKCGRQNSVKDLLTKTQNTQAEKDDFAEFQEVDFDPLSEPWSRYELEDGTQISVRMVALRIQQQVTTDGEPVYSITYNPFYAIRSPKHLRGPPKKTVPPPDVLNSLPRRKVKIVSKVEPWSTYLLETGKSISVKLRVTQIQRIEGVYDPEGNPYYEASTELYVEPQIKTRMSA
jgi:hypothetical protein